MGGQYDDLTREAKRPNALEQLMSSGLKDFEPLEAGPDTDSPPLDLSSPEIKHDRAGALG